MIAPLTNIEYYDANADDTKSAYFLREEEGRFYFCNGITLCIAKHLKRENEIIHLDSFSLPTNWTKISVSTGDFTYEPEGMIKDNFIEISEIVQRNFPYIHRIGEFLKEFLYIRENDVRVLKVLIIAVVITRNHLPESCLVELSSIVLRHYKDILQPYLIELILDNNVGTLINKEELSIYFTE